MMVNVEVRHGDNLELLREMSGDSIELGFTSPPYLDVIDYEEHVETLNGNVERWERDDIPLSEYRQFLVDRFEELFRVTKPGGHTIVNIAPVMTDEGRIPIHAYLVEWMMDIGWVLEADIIWEKPVATDRRSGVLIQNPYPGYYYPSCVTEYVLVFRKPDPTNEGIQRGPERPPIRSLWKIRQVSPGETDHPAPFPKELARRAIDLYSESSDTVIDIFSGSGTTGVACAELDREYIGLELLEEYVEIARERLSSIQMGLTHFTQSDN